MEVEERVNSGGKRNREGSYSALRKYGTDANHFSPSKIVRKGKEKKRAPGEQPENKGAEPLGGRLGYGVDWHVPGAMYRILARQRL